nr:LuxR family transcriptional regulator [Streptomyces cyanogenus]
MPRFQRQQGTTQLLSGSLWPTGYRAVRDGGRHLKSIATEATQGGTALSFLQRDVQWRKLEAALEACQRGATGVVLVEGSVGCGKTELLSRFAHEAALRGAQVLRAAGCPSSLATSHGVVRQLASEVPSGPLYATGGRPAQAALVPLAHGPRPAPSSAAAAPGRVPPAPTPLADRMPQQRSVRPDDEEAPFTAVEFSAALRTAAQHAPLVVCVDDLRYVDTPSLAQLLHAARTMRDTPLLLVLADAPPDCAERAQARTELLRHPGYMRLVIGPLTKAGTAAVLERTGSPADGNTVARLHSVTGGNPLLLRALLTEPSAPEPEHGGPFTQSALTCLNRSGAQARRMAAVLAVFEGEADTDTAARVARTTTSAAARAMGVLDRSGLTRDGRLSHPALAAAILDATPGPERAELHARAAQVLHENGARADLVARHLLLAASEAEQPADLMAGDWPVRVLCEAAQQALIVSDDSTHAAECLSLARVLCADEQNEWEVGLRQAAATWRTFPGAAEHHLRAPLAALRRGALGPAMTARLARLLVSQGRVEEAAEALGHIAGRQAGPREDPLRELFALPPALGPAAADPDEGRDATARAATALRAGAALWTHPGAEGEERVVERLLRGTPLAQTTFEPIVQAVRTLIHLDRPDRAVHWAKRLKADVQQHSAPAWWSAFGLVQAEGLLRLGDLAGAEQEAAAAADAVTDRGGLFLFGPIAVQVTALTAMGRYEEVTRRLQCPVPDELFNSVYALDFLRARGLYYLATHRYRAALGEFLDVGRLAQRWGLDRPRQLAWRTDAAEALLQLGEHRRAERLVVEQLGLPDARSPRVRGVSLRLRAAIAESRQRPRLLTSAVDELRRSGDRVELARALAELGRALRRSGEESRAGIVTRRARQLAQDCGALPLCEQVSPSQQGRTRQEEQPPPPQRPEPAAARTEQLSESERRVAALAGYGYTNREIAVRLYITVSTVEQHLTRVYRKLSITRRQDLPMELQFELMEDAARR